jgi:hypothetical protein
MSTTQVHRIKSLHLPKVEDAINAAVEQVGIFKRSGRILSKTAQAFVADNVSRLGAALAFYTTVAVAPLLVLTIALAGTVFAEADARERVIGEIQKLAGSQASTAVATVQSPTATATGTLATLLGFATLVFGAVGVFTNLQNALNTIWRVPPQPMKTWWHFLKQRLFSLATVMVTGFLLLVSLIARAANREQRNFVWRRNLSFCPGFPAASRYARADAPRVDRRSGNRPAFHGGENRTRTLPRAREPDLCLRRGRLTACTTSVVLLCSPDCVSWGRVHPRHGTEQRRS